MASIEESQTPTDHMPAEEKSHIDSGETARAKEVHTPLKKQNSISLEEKYEEAEKHDDTSNTANEKPVENTEAKPNEKGDLSPEVTVDDTSSPGQTQTEVSTSEVSKDTTVPNPPPAITKAIKPGSNTAQNEKPKISKLEQMKIDREKKKAAAKKKREQEKLEKEKAKKSKKRLVKSAMKSSEMQSIAVRKIEKIREGVSEEILFKRFSGYVYTTSRKGGEPYNLEKWHR